MVIMFTAGVLASVVVSYIDPSRNRRHRHIWSVRISAHCSCSVIEAARAAQWGTGRIWVLHAWFKCIVCSGQVVSERLRHWFFIELPPLPGKYSKNIEAREKVIRHVCTCTDSWTETAAFCSTQPRSLRIQIIAPPSGRLHSCFLWSRCTFFPLFYGSVSCLKLVPARSCIHSTRHGNKSLLCHSM